MPTVSSMTETPAYAPGDALYTVTAGGDSRKLVTMRVATIAAMKAIAAPTNGMSVEVTGDGTGGLFVFQTSLTESADNIRTHKADDATTGSWALQRSAVMERKIAGQQDFVDTCVSAFKPEKMRVSRVSDPYAAIRVSMLEKQRHISYEFRKNANDDFYMFHVAYFGANDIFDRTNVNATTLTGTWIGPDGTNNVYTITPGDSYTFTITGEYIEVHHLDDNRGGIMEAVIDGDTANAVRYSTYGTSSLVVAKVIATDLANTSHTVVVTFIGADPDNPPSGGVARGWAMDDYADVNPIRYTASAGVAFGGSYQDNTLALGYASNKSFALNVTYSGETHWIPEHNAVGTAFAVTDPVFVLDGVEYALTDLTIDDVYTVDSFQLKQNLNCQHPIAATDFANLKMVYTAHKENYIGVRGAVEFLQPCTVNDGYSMMLPITNAQIDTFVTGIGTRVTSLADGSVSYFPIESDRVFSIAGVGSNNPDVLVGMTVDNPAQAFRFGESGRGTLDRFTFMLHSATYPKVYFWSFEDAAVSSGYVYRFTGRYSVAYADDAFSTT